MGKQKRTWSAEQKLTAVLSVLKEQAISSSTPSSTSRANCWRCHSLTNCPSTDRSCFLREMYATMTGTVASVKPAMMTA